MPLEWNPFGLLGPLAAAMLLSMAAVVYFTRPHRPQNRRLALVLYLEGATAATGTGLIFMAKTQSVAHAFQAVAVICLIALVPAYLRFIATLSSRWVAPLRRPLVDRSLLLAIPLLPLLWFALPDAFVSGYHSVWFARWESLPGPLFLLTINAVGLVSLWGFIAATSVYRRAAPGLPRRQAAAFMLAFGLRDLFLATLAIGTLTPMLAPSVPFGAIALAIGPPVMQLVYMPLLAYGILKMQLFDIDLRIKTGVARTFVVAMVAIFYFVLTERLEGVLGDATGTGLIAAAGAALAIWPLHRLSLRLTAQLMPHVRSDDAYLDRRREEVFAAALQGAYHDGMITDKERMVLASLRAQLGISAEVATDLEARHRPSP